MIELRLSGVIYILYSYNSFVSGRISWWWSVHHYGSLQQRVSP